MNRKSFKFNTFSYFCFHQLIQVGIGNANFSAMVELDSDDGPLIQDGKKAVRDIVQFVELSKYINSELNVVDSDSENELAKETLYEVPEQVVNYFEMVGIKPQLWKKVG